MSYSFILHPQQVSMHPFIYGVHGYSYPIQDVYQSLVSNAIFGFARMLKCFSITYMGFRKIKICKFFSLHNIDKP